MINAVAIDFALNFQDNIAFGALNDTDYVTDNPAAFASLLNNFFRSQEERKVVGLFLGPGTGCSNLHKFSKLTQREIVFEIEKAVKEIDEARSMPTDVDKTKLLDKLMQILKIFSDISIVAFIEDVAAGKFRTKNVDP